MNLSFISFKSLIKDLLILRKSFSSQIFILTDSSILSINDSDSMRIPSSIEEISHINIALLNILIIHLEDYEIDLDAIKIIIHDNQIKVYQINLDIFNQLMK